MRKVPRNKKILDNAKSLRKSMTKEERHLWYDFLSQYSFRFRRQEIIGSYIADFYCDKAKLVIELDGSQHYQDADMDYDKKRTQYFQSLGIDVLRFSNIDINRYFDIVCAEIDKVVQERAKSLSKSPAQEK